MAASGRAVEAAHEGKGGKRLLIGMGGRGVGPGGQHAAGARHGQPVANLPNRFEGEGAEAHGLRRILFEQVETVAAQVDCVSPEDIQRTVRRYFDRRQAHLTCVGVLEDELLADLRRLLGA